MEEKCIFKSEDYQIEGRIDKKDDHRGVVITHPHPLYGGDMFNSVVETLYHVYHKNGYTTLRFNFRGVGKSQGSYGKGAGEQKDVLAAHSHLMNSGMTKIDLAGYSFGAWVNALAARKDIPVRRMVMVSPPVAVIDFGTVTSIPFLKLVVAGDRDEFAPPELIRKMFTKWNPDAHFEIINGADHFYGGYLNALETILSANLHRLSPTSK